MNRASRYLINVSVLTFVRVVIVGVIVCMCHHATPSDGKVFERCELAQLLRYGHGLDVNDVANWVCIAQHSSSLNSSAFGGDVRSGSHGLFQISDQYWCSPPGKGVACGVTCDRLRDDDIGDDLDCVRTIYEEHQRLSGDGYNAWIAYQPYCRENPYEYVEDCFGNEEKEYLHSKSITANYVEDEEEDEADYEPYPSKKRGKVYGRCELAKELFLKHKMPMEEIPTWVCIAQHESNYDTSAVGRLNADGSADHGLFQISDLYWCSHKGSRRKACGLPCSKLLDSDITDDVKCVKQIFKEHTRISGDGFTAWTVYNAYCHGKTANYIRGCFDGIDVQDSSASEEYKSVRKPSRVSKHQKPHGKVYEPCELAEELRSKHHLPEDQIAIWVCIAKHESDYNTSAIGYGDHGLFQISDIYWCSPPGKGWACGLSCSDLEDSDISDDVECIRKIYAEHMHLSGDGFNAWTVYPRHCSDGRAEKYISHCAGNNPRPAVTAPPHTHSKLTNPNSIEDDYQPKRGKVYGRCELAKELLTKYEMSMDEIPTWVCIAHHESNFDTSAVGRRNTDGSADHGLFQISDLYWCSHKEGHRKACGLPCSKLLDNDISDDIKCIKQIHDEHTRISGDGFNAWTVYDAYCKERTEQYIRGCFDGSAPVEDFKPRERTIDYGFLPKNKPKGKVYEECELAKELRDKHHIPKDQISTWVCIAKHQSGLNTSSSVSNVHGMFHISDEYWCSPPGKGKVCELNCSDLEDSDITDDIDCISKIYLEHQRLFGNGFSAWVVYPQHCSDGRADDYVGHCPGFESPRTNAITYGTPKLISISDKPVFNHVFNENPFLRHFDLVDSDAASKINSVPVEESFSASDEVDTILPANHEFSLNPFLKHINSKQDKPIEKSFKTTTSPPAFLGVPIAPTPTKASRLQTYQPQNEEQAKYEAFKAFATPSLPLTTQTPRANRLQTYQLNTFNAFKTFPTPTLPTAPPTTTNRLQPYQLNTFNSFKTTATPTTQPLTTKSSLPTVQQPQSSTKPYTVTKTATPTLQPLSTKIPLPTAQPKPHTSTRTPLAPVSKDSGRYDSGRYDSGRYDAGRYDPGRYNPAISQPTPQSSRTPTAILSSKQYPIATSSLQYKAPVNIKITSTTLSSSKPFDTSTQKPEQPLNTRSPSISTNSGRYEPFKAVTTPAFTTKIYYDPFKQFSTTTLRPTTTVTSSKKFEAYKAVNSGKYVPYKPPSTPKDASKYIPNKSLATPSQTTKSSAVTVTNPTKKFDPFKPFGNNFESYNPFKAFSTGQQQPSSFNFLSAKATSSNELDFAPSSSLKRETQTSGSPTNLRTSLTSKRETKSSQQKKPATSSIVIATKPQVTATSIRLGTTTPTQTSKAPTSSVPAKSSRPSTMATTISSQRSSRSATTSSSTSKSNVLTSSDKNSATPKPASIVTSKPTLSVYRQNTATPTRLPPTSILTTKPQQLTQTTRSDKTSAIVKPTSVVTSKPTHSAYRQNIATPTRLPPTFTSTTKSQKITQTTTRSISSIKSSATAKPSSIITSKPTVSVYRQNTATPTRLPPTSTSTTKPQQLTQTTKSDKTSATAKPTSVVTSKPTLNAYRQNTATPTRLPPTSISTTKPQQLTQTTTRSIPSSSITISPKASIVTSKPALSAHRQTRSTKTTATAEQASIKTTATVTSPQPSVVPTRTESQKSLNPSKVTATLTKSTTRSTSKRPSTATVITPTKSHRSSESLYSTRLNIYDLYYKLYGVHPPHRTSSGAQQVTKTSQTNVVPSRTL